MIFVNIHRIEVLTSFSWSQHMMKSGHAVLSHAFWSQSKSVLVVAKSWLRYTNEVEISILQRIWTLTSWSTIQHHSHHGFNPPVFLRAPQGSLFFTPQFYMDHSLIPTPIHFSTFLTLLDKSFPWNPHGPLRFLLCASQNFLFEPFRGREHFWVVALERRILILIMNESDSVLEREMRMFNLQAICLSEISPLS
jgi:hypothetical protein